MPKPVRKAWNGGNPEAARIEAQERRERAIASGCAHCPRCDGAGAIQVHPYVCDECGGAGYLVPHGGMPAAKPLQVH